jgi:kinesin family protein 6/9
VLGAGCGQADVFDAVARDAVDAALDGYNATVFAYGQTGSGKTWTITGGPERFADRGVIPRALARLFAGFAAAAAAPPVASPTPDADAGAALPPAPPPPPRHFTATVSYLEVYNEVGYDLLDSAAAAARAGGGGGAGSRASTASDGGGPLTPRSGSREYGRFDGERDGDGGRGRSPSDGLRRVHVMEDEGGGQHLRGLSRHACAGEEDALNLLFLGDTQRAMAETALNPASTRSHCIFTVHVEARAPGSATVTRSKLHLVDLAG